MKKPALAENRSLNRFKWVTCFSFELRRWKQEWNLENFVTFFLGKLYTCIEEFEDVGSRMDEWELTKVRIQEIKKKKTQLRQLVTVCWSCGAESGFFGRSKFVLKQTKKHLFFFVRKRKRYWNGVAFAFSKVSTK